MRSETACFTGHRVLPAKEIPAIGERLEKTLTLLIKQGYRCFEAGGALGFDTLAAQTILRLRERYPQTSLTLVLPCPEQTHSWSPADIDSYEEIKRRADRVICTAEHYFRGCMQKRDRYLVDDSSVCLACLTRAIGGTAYTVNYARRRGLRIVNIAEPNESG